MNGDMNGNPPPAVSGGEVDPMVIKALEVVHDPRSSNDHRNQAYEYLESSKRHIEAPQHGFILASSSTQDPSVRHFGLSLLESAVKYHWNEYSSEQTDAVRGWILQLTQAISSSDPPYIRNKIAQLWTDVAKRSWMLEWKNMDELLVQIWQGGPIEKFFVMEVLENLAENSFGKEDSVAAIRGDDLSNYCLDIFTPAAVFKEHYPKRDDLGCRYGEEGWLLRVVDFMSWCLGQDPKDQTVAACAVKSATMLKSCLEWVLLKAIVVTGTQDRLCQALMSSNTDLVLEALQCLFLLFSRRLKFESEDVAEIVLPMFSAENVEIMRKIYTWSTVSPDEIDPDRYLICKKLTPLLFQLGLFIESRPEDIFGKLSLDPYFDLLLTTVDSQSLHVGIPVLHLWAFFLSNERMRKCTEILQRVGPLLEICSRRLLRYEDLSPNEWFAPLIFLEEDVETSPERHQFLGNYARFAKEIVDGIVQQQPAEALEHILNQTSELLEHLYDGEEPFDAEKVTRFTSVPALKLDAQASVIEAAVFGYAKWRSEQRANNPNPEDFAARQTAIDQLLAKWTSRWISHSFEDPAVQQRLVIIFISLAVGPLRKNPQIVSSIFQYIIQTKTTFVQKETPSTPDSMWLPQHDELQRFCSHQLQRLAIKSHDFLAPQYDAIERELEKFTTQLGFGNDDRERVLSVPFIILQRARGLPEEQRQSKLLAFAESRLSPWSDPKLAESLQNLESFCNLAGLAGFQDQFLALGAPVVPDWSTVMLRGDRAAFKNEIENSKRHIPIRITRTILGASVDRAEGASLDVAKAIWAKHIPVMLPHIVTLIKLSIQFSAPSTWSAASVEVQQLLKRIMKDRFWQVGISTGTRDEFYSRVTSSKDTLEGLASAVRGCIREVRETCFKILALLTYLGDLLYQYDGLPAALCEAMFSHPMALSTHQTVVLLETSRAIIEQCPKDRVNVFLPHIMTTLFEYLDEKISREWSVLDQKKEGASEDDDLTEEMKEESILRNLTFTAVMFVTRLFDPNPAQHANRNRDPVQQENGAGAPGPQRLDIFIMENPQIFKAIITFCKNVLRMHDSRCCTYVVKIMRQIIPVFAVASDDTAANNPNLPQLSSELYAEIREFISTEVLKACITSLHDPYFVDIQPDLAGLIARIITNYAVFTPTPRAILLSLPDMSEQKVDSTLSALVQQRESKKQRNLVLVLLAGLRGVSVAEQGKIFQAAQRERAKKQDATNKYAQASIAVQDVKARDDDDGGLEGVADMFQGA